MWRVCGTVAIKPLSGSAPADTTAESSTGAPTTTTVTTAAPESTTTTSTTAAPPTTTTTAQGEWSSFTSAHGA